MRVIVSMLPVLMLLAVGCAAPNPQVTRAQLERLKQVYAEDVDRCRCARGQEASGECLPPKRIEAGERLFDAALKRFDDAE